MYQAVPTLSFIYRHSSNKEIKRTRGQGDAQSCTDCRVSISRGDIERSHLPRSSLPRSIDLLAALLQAFLSFYYTARHRNLSHRWRSHTGIRERRAHTRGHRPMPCFQCSIQSTNLVIRQKVRLHRRGISWEDNALQSWGIGWGWEGGGGVHILPLFPNTHLELLQNYRYTRLSQCLTRSKHLKVCLHANHVVFLTGTIIQTILVWLQL